MRNFSLKAKKHFFSNSFRSHLEGNTISKHCSVLKTSYASKCLETEATDKSVSFLRVDFQELTENVRRRNAF